jgi:hypothetical protein
MSSLLPTYVTQTLLSERYRLWGFSLYSLIHSRLLLFMSMGWDYAWTTATNGSIVHPTGEMWVLSHGGMTVSGENWRNSEKNPECHSGHHESHMHGTRRESKPPRWKAGDKQPEPWHDTEPCYFYFHPNVLLGSRLIDCLIDRLIDWLWWDETMPQNCGHQRAYCSPPGAQWVLLYSTTERPEQWLTLVLRTGEVPRSNPGPETGYLNWLSWFYLVTPHKSRDTKLN